MSENKWTKELLQQKLRQPLPESEVFTVPRLSAMDWSYREAASVLAYYDPTKLHPLEARSSVHWNAVRRLLSDSIRVFDEDNRPWWMLRNSVRKKALARLGNRDRMKKALQVNIPPRRDGLQRMLELYIDDSAPLLEAQNLNELLDTLKVVDWLEGILEELPKVEEVQRRIGWERLLEPFRYLVGDHFRGRQEELSMLRNYVGVLPPDSATAFISRGLRSIFSLHEKPPLLIYGLGGIGKSTLLGKFILEHMQAHREARFPFTYIDFDRPEFLAEEPLTILYEALRQLGIEYPEIDRQCQRLRRDWTQRMAQEEERQTELNYKSTSVKGSISPIEFRRPFLEDFAKIMQAIGEIDKPYLLVLDTFEEVQYRSRDFVAELWAFLEQMQHILPRLRTVLAGRAPIVAFATKELHLREFDLESGLGFLNAQGIEDDLLARTLFKQIGGNPLSLQLAASVVAKEGTGSKGVTDLETQKHFFFRVQESQIQGQLYRRILNHIHNPDVRKLAHPGLVLRRITPEIIEEVLAVPCGIELKDRAGYRRLFDELQREVTLVHLDDDGALVHRSDVRKAMLEALLQDEPARVYQIQQRAVAYYEKQYNQNNNVRMRAEEIYHRFFLAVDVADVDKYWLSGIEPFLSTAVDEIPARMRPYLASRLGIESEEIVWNEADLASWERYAERRVRDLMDLNRFEQAREVLAERAERTPGSPLYLLETQVLVQLQEWDAARRVVKAGIYAASQVHDDQQLLELLQISARVDEQLKFYRQARQMLDGARDAAEKLKDKQRLLEIAVHRQRLNRLDPLTDAAVAAEDRQALVDLLDHCSDRELSRNPLLLRDLAGEMGGGNPDVILRIARLQGLGQPDDFQRKVLAEALTAWDTQVSQEEGRTPGMLARRGDVKMVGDLAQSWALFAHKASPSRLSKVLTLLGTKHELSPDVTRWAAEILQNPQKGGDVAT